MFVRRKNILINLKLFSIFSFVDKQNAILKMVFSDIGIVYSQLSVKTLSQNYKQMIQSNTKR